MPLRCRFRRLLRDARALGEPFEIVYTSLSGNGDEQWRIHAAGRTLKLQVPAATAAAASEPGCSVLAAGEGGAAECRADDAALAPFPARDFVARPFSAALGFLQLSNSLPIVSDDDTEVHCCV